MSCCRLEFTEARSQKSKILISDEDNPNLKLRVYITGGGLQRFPVRLHLRRSG
ncbi:Iron-sulfur cluster insertion protein erpA [Raoultella terrigena]|uniref:Iron-sulfur cluster insertion protein erpA n=1 Tax=Raoultella terrigena TaxID=577 RepID=A0A4U9D918_RAOTE|nr:Iron-sulfur cluster insertion protein erpA [Raoultella terrigena]